MCTYTSHYFISFIYLILLLPLLLSTYTNLMRTSSVISTSLSVKIINYLFMIFRYQKRIKMYGYFNSNFIFLSFHPRLFVSNALHYIYNFVLLIYMMIFVVVLVSSFSTGCSNVVGVLFQLV
jgi:hypothetical protein